MNFNASKEETETIKNIAERFIKLVPEFSIIDVMMDLEAVHCNDVELDLERLFKADDSNLIHDVCGINKHLNRNNGKLENCFLPRYTKTK